MADISFLAVSLAVCVLFFLFGRISKSERLCMSEVLFLSSIVKDLRKEIDSVKEKTGITPKVEEIAVVKQRRKRRKKVAGEIV